MLANLIGISSKQDGAGAKGKEENKYKVYKKMPTARQIN